jgi:hypothetical protein
MSEIPELTALVTAALALFSEGDRDAATAKLLEAAEHDPLDHALHAALEQLHPFTDLTPSEDDLASFTRGAGLWRAFQRAGGRLGFPLELLPEQGRVDESLFRLPPRDRGPEVWVKTSLGVPTTLGGHIPRQPESHGGYTTYDRPDMTVVDGVLRVQQFSQMKIKPWEISTETMAFTAYRVRGALFHGRWSRVHYYRYR